MAVKKLSANVKKKLKDSQAKESVKEQIIEETQKIIHSIKNSGLDPMTADLASLFPYLAHRVKTDTDMWSKGEKQQPLEKSQIQQLEAVMVNQASGQLEVALEDALHRGDYKPLIAFAYLWRFYIPALSVGVHADSLFEALHSDAFQLKLDQTTQEVLDEVEELVGDIRTDIFGALSTPEEKERQGVLVGLAAQNDLLHTYVPDIFLIRINYESISELTYDSLPSWFATVIELDVNMRDTEKLKDSHRIQFLMNNLMFRINKEGGAKKDADNLMVFDHVKGLWTHNENEFSSMWAQLGGDEKNMKSALAKIAGLTRRKPKNEAFMVPYNGSHYIALLNGVLDVSELELITFNEARERGVTFTDYQQLQFNYNPDRNLPIIRGGALDGGDWDPHTFFYTLAEEDPLKYEYFMFCLSLGFFPRHNFGVNVSIKGSSGSGKSSLSHIYVGALTHNNVATGLFSDLNSNFPLQKLKPHSSLIWLNEANRAEGISLKSSSGEPVYNSLADGSCVINIKNGTIEMDNPPQVYVEGTDLVTSSDPSNGMTRRTLPYVFAPDNFLRSEGREGRYKAVEIEQLLRYPEILEWIFNEAIKAYRAVVPDYILEKDSVKLSLNDKNILSWFDRFEFFHEWHSGVVKTNETLYEFFDAVYDAIVFMDNPDGTPNMDNNNWAHGFFISDDILYKIYEYYYQTEITSRARDKYKVQQLAFSDQWGKYLATKGVYRLFLCSNERVRKYVGDLKVLLHSAHDRKKTGEFCFGVDYRLMIEQQSIPARAKFEGHTAEDIEWKRRNEAEKLGKSGSELRFDLENDNLSPLEVAIAEAFGNRSVSKVYQFYHQQPQDCKPYKKGTALDFVQTQS